MFIDLFVLAEANDHLLDVVPNEISLFIEIDPFTKGDLQIVATSEPLLYIEA